MRNNKKVGWLLSLSFLLVIIGRLSYHHLFYQPQKVEGGLAKLHMVFEGHHDIATGVRFMPNDSLVITGSVDSTVKIWKPATGEVVRTIRQPSGVTYIDLSSDGEYIITGSYDEKVRIYRLIDGALVHELKGHKGTVWNVAFNPDGNLAASCGDDKVVKVWNTSTGALVHNLEGHSLVVWAVKFSSDGSRLTSCSFDQSFKTWDVATGRLLEDNKQHTETVVDVSYSHDGNLLATTSDDCTIKIWSTRNGAQVRSLEVPEHVQAVAFSPDDKLLVTGGRDKTMIGELVQNFLGETNYNKGVTARLWDVASGRVLQTFTEHTNDLMDVSYSHDGNWIATASADHTVHIWKVGRH